MKTTKTVILTAPQGWGKTRNAPKLQAEFGCSGTVDGWWPGQPLKAGALHLTNVPPDRLRGNKPEVCRVVARGWA